MSLSEVPARAPDGAWVKVASAGVARGRAPARKDLWSPRVIQLSHHAFNSLNRLASTPYCFILRCRVL